MSLNTPEIRQRALAQRLARGGELDLAALAGEFGVSTDTMRRDLIALEERGLVERVRGGAVPRAVPAVPMTERRNVLSEAVLTLALAQVAGANTLVLDGGTSVAALAARLQPRAGLLVVTPAPAVALAAQACGIEVALIGGTMSARGGIATGAETCAALARIAADVTVLGACGLDAEFGLSSDDAGESAVKATMAACAPRCLILTGAEKVGTRARHRTLPPETIDLVITDRALPALAEAPFEILHA
ncbi:DeoR/GlpR family DNA-binding transcription regulator [Pararhodobacter sp. CCB-MM2]|uniref:DeoR/GlpR family DNA-binding transcription regulator n=1 Tax=Pararhodobacter sp. CCB-MM2 TaxID=1786003 RepID=UPI00082DD369|nr:DeoR/GlpR family DNA-binding transcription regulator [Pararhodobacter sp. CCB-MM2]